MLRILAARLLCLLINLVEHDADNRSTLADMHLGSRRDGESMLAILGWIFVQHGEMRVQSRQRRVKDEVRITMNA